MQEKNKLTQKGKLNTDISTFNLHPALTDALAQMGWTTLTPIQAKTLPLTLQGVDVAGKAQTGTGKTGAFLIALFEYLLKNPVKSDETGPWAIILAPTRELAMQIYENALEIGCYTGLKPVAIYGGKDYDKQKEEFIGSQPDIIIGTPGRIIDLFKQRLFNLKNIDVLVLDEADRMFDLGFISDIQFLLRKMPVAATRLNLIFSATFTYRVQELAYEYLNAPKLIEVESENETADDVVQSIYHVANDEKPQLLAGLLKKLNPEKCLVFVNTKQTLERLTAILQHNGFQCVGLSGDIAQHRREKLLKEFQTGEKTILVATDVAARGLHIEDISHVFNYDLPQHPEDYIHRIGRTARAGKSGEAISFGCEDYAYHLPEIEDKIADKIPVKSLSNDLLVAVEIPEFKPTRRNAPRKSTPRSKTSTNRTGSRRQPRKKVETEKE